MTRVQQPPVPGETLLQHISRHVFLTILHIGWAKLSHQIDDAEVSIAVNPNDTPAADAAEVAAASAAIDTELRSNPQWKLMPKRWTDIFGNIEGRARRLVRSASISFATAGVSALPMTRAGEIFRGLRNLRAEFNTQKTRFCAEYAALLQEIRAQLPNVAVANKALAKLPAYRDIANKFSFVWAILPVGGQSNVDLMVLERVRDLLAQAVNGRGTRAQELHLAEMALQLLQDAMTAATGTPATLAGDPEVEQLVTEARHQMAQFTDSMLDDMVNEPHDQVATTINNLIEAITSPDRFVRQGTIDQTIRALRTMQGFSFLAPPETTQAIQLAIRTFSGLEPAELNGNPERGESVVRALQRTLAIINNRQATETIVARFRGIRISTPAAEPEPAGSV
jgi:Protein of unknown function (DUF3150)